jgi:hypothetical protein
MASERPIGRWGVALAGPALIVASVLVVLHGFWLHPKLTNQQVDLLAFWMPRWCYLGDSLSAGHVPTWLTNQFGGVPYASDPQSGWLYVPAMALFMVFGCVRALGLFIVLQPILAGLGLYGFFRHEGASRPASTVGGLTLALSVTGGSAVLSLPFSGTLAWTAIALAGASGYLHARTPLRIGLWMAFTAFAVSQIAAAHMTDGLLIGAAIIGLYVLARSVAQVRAGERSRRSAALIVILPFLAFPVLAAAMLIPRLALLPRTSIGHGYRALGELANRLSGTDALPPLYAHGLGPWWGTAFARGPGGYVGALGILLVPAALASKRFRWPAAAFAVLGFVGWLVNLDRLIGSPAMRRFALNHSIGELWLRSPDRFRYLLLFAFAGLAGYGMQAWLDMRLASDRRGLARRAAWFAPPVAVFVVGPLIAGARPAEYVLFLVGCAYSGPLLLLLARGARWPAGALPALLAAELAAAGVVGQLGPIPKMAVDRLPKQPSSGLGHAYPKYHAPFILPTDYTTPGPIGTVLVGARGTYGRYFTFDPSVSRSRPRGFLFNQGRRQWGGYENGRSVLLDLDEIQGYSPVQLDRYWRLVRATNDQPIYYNSASFQNLDPAVLKLFGVEWLIQPSRMPPPDGMPFVAKEGAYSLYRVPQPEPRASVVYDARPVAPGQGLRDVLDPAFDPDTEAIYEPAGRGTRTGLGPGVNAGAATYRELTPEHVRVSVTSSAPGLLLVRNAFDDNWVATIDGLAAPVLRTDYMMQGVMVPSGSHEVELRYRDEPLAIGLMVSGTAWLIVAALLAWLWARQRRPRGRPDVSSIAEGSGSSPQ